MLAERYRLLRRIAVGGMGSVHEAVDERLGRRVAVKILNVDYAHDPSCVERFSREARAAAGLIHPNIAQVFDSGHDAGQYYIVVEYVDGADLGHELSRRIPLLTARAAKIADQLCSGLAAAHSVGIVHRDVKPSNVLLGPGDHVKLTDFGIAKVRGQAALTATGFVLGSAKYLSPEQADGQTATPASDLYSAGIVLFEMLTGTVPFTGPSPIDIAHDHLTREVPPVRGLAPGVPPMLAAVVARATAKNPSVRFPDAAAMQAELRDAVEATGERSPKAVLPAATQSLDPPATAAAGTGGAPNPSSSTPGSLRPTVCRQMANVASDDSSTSRPRSTNGWRARPSTPTTGVLRLPKIQDDDCPKSEAQPSESPSMRLAPALLGTHGEGETWRRPCAR
jgi:eukaryotic-like serine/threonine-protein kinase